MIRQFRHPVQRRWWALLAVLILAAACGGETAAPAGGESSPGTAGGGASEGGAQQAADGDCGDTLTVGILVPLTGELGDFGEVWQNAMELAVADVGGSDALPEGWSIDAVVGDEQTNAEEGVRAAQNMINADEVSVITGPTSGPIVAMVDLAAQSQTPIISSAAGTISLNELGGEWIYRTVASDQSDGLAIAQWLNDQGIADIGMLVQNEETTVSIAAAAREAYTAGGGEIIEEVNYSPGQPSYQAEVQSVVQANPSLLLLAGGQESGITIIREARQLGYEGDIFVTADMVVPAVIEALGPELSEGLYGEAGEADTALPAYQAFEETYTEEYGEAPELFTANSYDAVVIAALAATAAESTCGAAINERLREVSGPPGVEVTTYTEGAEALAEGEDIDYSGASGSVDLDETGTPVGSYGVFQVTEGEWTEVEFYPADTFDTES